MLDIIKQLLDKDLVTEDTRAEIQEAWDQKISEVKEEAKTEVREEFAKRYEHDKSVMVEAMDRLMNESLKKEISEFVEDRKNSAYARVRTPDGNIGISPKAHKSILVFWKTCGKGNVNLLFSCFQMKGLSLKIDFGCIIVLFLADAKRYFQLGFSFSSHHDPKAIRSI